MNKHRIAISMEDTDIEREMAILIITTNDNSSIILEKLKTAFENFDRAEGIAEEYRQDGWGISSFIAYLNHIYEDWQVEEDIPDMTLKFVGM